jgi:hypothetical protein
LNPSAGIAANAVGGRGLTLLQLQTAVVWLLLATSFFVRVEPAICDVLFVVVLALHVASGLTLSSAVAPLIAYLILYNIGAYVSSLYVVGDEYIVRMFVVTSVYMAMTAIFFAFYVAHDPMGRMPVIRNAWIVAAGIVSFLGILGYFNVAGTADVFAYKLRAVGTFKDPNVFSTYIIPPAIMLLHGFLLGTQQRKLLSGITFLVIMAALFLAFSRGAWISFIFSAALVTGLTFLLTPSVKMRGRIVVLTIFGVIGIVVLLAILLSIPEVRGLFLDRFTLVKDYDAGETGRFGNQLNSIPILMERPLGFGPFQFHYYFGMDPHNTFINAFSAYGWLGGFSYMLLIISTLVIGFKTVFMRTPWQNYAIAVFCPLLATILQGVQIDTDHWRHLYWMLGIMWGLYAASASHALKHGRLKLR